MSEEAKSEKVKQPWPKRGVWLGVLAVVLTVALCVVAIYYKDDLMSMTHMAGYSLLGVLVVAFVAGSFMSITMVPVPYILLVFTMPGILAPHWGILAAVWVGIISALGASLGQLLTFMIGYGGRNLYEKSILNSKNRFYTRAMSWAQRHGSWAVFLMSAVVNPIHLPMTIAMATLRYHPLKFFFFSLLGNAVKSLVIAFCGYFGLSSLFHFLGL